MSYAFSLTTSNDYGFAVSSTDTWTFSISETIGVEVVEGLITKDHRYIITKDGNIITPKQ